MPDPGRVDDEAAGLGVLPESVVEPGLERVGPVHDRLEIIGDDHREHAAVERPRRVEPGDHLLEGLAVGGVDELVPRVDRREDQPVRDSPDPARRVRDQPEPTEVDLQLDPGIAVGDRDRRPPPPEPQLGHREPVQRPVGHHHPAALE
jgi:hypothetical protein